MCVIVCIDRAGQANKRACDHACTSIRIGKTTLFMERRNEDPEPVEKPGNRHIHFSLIIFPSDAALASSHRTLDRLFLWK